MDAPNGNGRHHIGTGVSPNDSFFRDLLSDKPPDPRSYAYEHASNRAAGLALAAYIEYHQDSSIRRVTEAGGLGYLGDFNWVDPLEMLYDGVASGGAPILPKPWPLIAWRNQLRGEDVPVQNTWEARQILLDRMRYVVAVSGFAQSVLINRQNYVIGEGYKPRVEADSDHVPEIEIRKAQRLVDLFCECNELGDRQREAMIRYDVEGEYFVRWFPQDDGMPKVREIEPELVRSNMGDADRKLSYGIISNPVDSQEVLAYNVIDHPSNPKANPVDARYIIHRKANTMKSAKRGRSLFYPVEQRLIKIEQTMNSLSAAARARAKFAMIRKLLNSSPTGANNLLGSVTATTVTDPLTGQQRNIEQFQDGQILTSTKGIEYEFPKTGMETESFVEAIMMDLKAVASAAQLPIWMVCADQEDMAAYTAAMVAESPSIRNFQVMQAAHKGAWVQNRLGPARSLINRVLWYWADRGYLNREYVPFLKVVADGPSLVVRNKGDEAQVNSTYVQMGVKSIETVQIEQELDPEVENERIAEEAQRKQQQGAGQAKPGALPGQAQPSQSGQLQPGQQVYQQVQPDQPAGAAGDLPPATSLYGEQGAAMEAMVARVSEAVVKALEAKGIVGATRDPAIPDDAFRFYREVINRTLSNENLQYFFNAGDGRVWLSAAENMPPEQVQAIQSQLLLIPGMTKKKVIITDQEPPPVDEGWDLIEPDGSRTSWQASPGERLATGMEQILEQIAPRQQEAHVLEDHGPAPRPGLVFDEGSKRWVRREKKQALDKKSAARQDKSGRPSAPQAPTPGGKAPAPAAPASPENAEQAEKSRQGRIKSLVSQIAKLPGKVADKAHSVVVEGYRHLEEEYGSTGALLVVGATVMLAPVHPGASLLPVALAAGVKKLLTSETVRASLEGIEKYVHHEVMNPHTNVDFFKTLMELAEAAQHHAHTISKIAGLEAEEQQKQVPEREEIIQRAKKFMSDFYTAMGARAPTFQEDGRVTEDHGAPPFPGLEFDEHKHRWVKPGQGGEQTPATSQHYQGEKIRVGDAAAVAASHLLDTAGSIGHAMREKSHQLYDAIRERYGVRTAAAVFLSGHAIAWGAFGAGILTGHPNWIPSEVAMLPAAALAEIAHQIRRWHGDVEETPQTEEMGKQLVKDLDAHAKNIGHGSKLSEQLVAGGFSYQPLTQTSPKDGFMVSPYKDREHVIDLSQVSGRALKHEIAQYVIKNRDLLHNKDHFMGAWVDSGKAYIDISVRRDSLSDALELAKKHQQLAVFDLAKMATIYTETGNAERPTTNRTESAERQDAGSVQGVHQRDEQPPDAAGGGRGPERGRVGETLARVLEGADRERLKRVLEEHGPPPRPGLIFDEQVHRWVRPEEHSDKSIAKSAGTLTELVPGYKGTGTAGDPVRCKDNLELAAHLLAAGKHVRLAQPEQVATLLDKLYAIIQTAKADGDEAPNIDLCKISVKGTNLFCQENLGIPRIKMPQMRGMAVPGTYAATLPASKKTGKVDLTADFIAHLQRKGIKVKETAVPASHLRASQKEIVAARVVEMIEEAKEGKRDLREKPIFVTRDHYVVDGHHHWAAIVGYGYGKEKDLKVPVYMLDMEIGQALLMANDFAKRMGISPKAAATTPAKAHEAEQVQEHLLPGKDEVGHNIGVEMAAGKPRKQAIAIALHHADEADEGAFKILPVPDVIQEYNWDCGAAGSMSVGLLRGVGPESLDEWRKNLGTSKAESTWPDAIAHYFTKLGCPVEYRDNMTLEDLAGYIERGWPILTPIQEYMHDAGVKAEGDYGHWVVVCGIVGEGDDAHVVVQDPSEDNVDRSSTGTDNEPGKALIDAHTFMDNWHDRGDVRCGIAVGPIADKSNSGPERTEESHGPPPRPGLQFNETKHRWVRPQQPAIADRRSLPKIEDRKPNHESPGSSGVPPNRRSRADPWEGETPQEYQSSREKLSTEEVKEKQPIRGGHANEAKFITLEDGTRAVFKSARGEEEDLRDDIEAGTYYQRESAASSIAALLGMQDLVPPTTTREVDGEIGSAQQFSEGIAAYKMSSDEAFDGDEDAARAAAFDFLIDNSDRHNGNWFVNNGKLVLIDNGLSFGSTDMQAIDMGHQLMMAHAVQENLTVPEIKAKWDDILSALTREGIDDSKTIDGARWRFDLLKQYEGQTFQDMAGAIRNQFEDEGRGGGRQSWEPEPSPAPTNPEPSSSSEPSSQSSSRSSSERPAEPELPPYQPPATDFSQSGRPRLLPKPTSHVGFVEPTPAFAQTPTGPYIVPPPESTGHGHRSRPHKPGDTMFGLYAPKFVPPRPIWAKSPKSKNPF